MIEWIIVMSDITVLNDSPNHTLRLIIDGKVLGQFYNSWDGLYHLSEYVPYRKPPTKYVCGGVGNFSPSRKEDTRDRCPICWAGIPV